MEMLDIFGVSKEECAMLTGKRYSFVENDVISDIGNRHGYWGNEGLNIPLQLVTTGSGIKYFNFIEKMMLKSVKDNIRQNYSGNINPYTKTIDDIIIWPFRVEFNVETGNNHFRSRYAKENYPSWIYCDYNVAKKNENIAFSFQLTTIRFLHTDHISFNRDYEIQSIFVYNNILGKEEICENYNIVLTLENNCSLLTEFNPLNNEPFPKDERETFLYHFSNNGGLTETEFLKYDPEIGCKVSEVSFGNSRNMSLNIMQIDLTNVTFHTFKMLSETFNLLSKRRSVDINELFASCGF
jgi:hypothetical protein